MKKRISILIAALSIFGITLAQQEPLNSLLKYRLIIIKFQFHTTGKPFLPEQSNHQEK